MVQLKIGLDFDDVIAWSHPVKPRIAKELFGVSIPWDEFQKHLVVERGLLTEEQYEEVGRRTFHGEHNVRSVKWAFQYIDRLQREGHILRIVTSRSFEGGTLPFALKWFKAFGHESLEVRGVGYGNSKLEACRDLDVYVDDDGRKLEPLVGVVPHLINFVWPYDRRDPGVPEITRVEAWPNGWHQVYAIIATIAQARALASTT